MEISATKRHEKVAIYIFSKHINQFQVFDIRNIFEHNIKKHNTHTEQKNFE